MQTLLTQVGHVCAAAFMAFALAAIAQGAVTVGFTGVQSVSAPAAAARL